MGQPSEHEHNRLDQIQTQFRSAWNAGRQPSIKEFLESGGDDAGFRIEILKVLIPVDIEMRALHGEIVSADVYSDLGDAAKSIANHFFSMDDTPHLDDATWRSDQSDFVIAGGARPSLEKTVVADKYKLIHEIGAGGMGTVWLAQQEKPVRRQVALKVLRTAIGSREALVRFEAERQALAMMNHPNIAQVLDAGTMLDGSPFLVMELVKGKPFTQYCNENRLTIRKRLELIIPVCHAIQHAHQKGIIHRDIKPSNILISVQGDEPTPKVIDFGLAKAQESQTRLTEESMMTEFGQVLGTLQYMSPEQAGTNNLDVDARTDIYSLGVVLYQLLTSTTPLDRKTIAQNSFIQIIDKICKSEMQRPSIRLAGKQEDLAIVAAQRQIEPKKLTQLLAGELDWIALKALERNRSDRYQTAKDLADEIQRYLDNEPVIARPPSRAYLLKKFVYKHRGLVASALLIAGLLIAGTVTSTYFFLQAATVEKRRTKQLNVYTKLFEKTNPLSGASKGMSTADLLSNAEKDVMQSFDDDPVGKVELLHVIGNSFEGQGYHQNAITTLENAWTLQKQLTGPNDLKSLVIQEDLAIAYSRVDADRMFELMQGVFEGREKVLSKDSELMMATRHSFATAAFFKFKENKKKDIVEPDLLEKAIKMFQENYTFQQQALGANHPDTLKTLTNLANSYLKGNQIEKAIVHTEKALKGWKIRAESATAEEDRNVAISKFLKTKNNYAETLFADKQIDRAIDVYLETLEEKEKRYDVGHGDWRITLRLVMEAMHKHGQTERAEKLFDEAYQKVKLSDGVFRKDDVLKAMMEIESDIFGAEADDKKVKN